MSLLVANVVASKIVPIFSFYVPAAVVAYAITFLCTDIISERYGKQEANEAVKRGFIIQIFFMVLVFLAVMLPNAQFNQEYANKFNEVFTQSVRMVIASLIAYLISQKIDVYLFHFFKSKFKAKWIRNNLSTMTSQLIDTSIFITIAFYGVVPNLMALILGQYFIKLIIAFLDTPLFYVFTRKPYIRGLE